MSRTPVYEQIIDQVEKFVTVGILKKGDQLPSVRSLSLELSVNPNTVQKAFNDLFGRGIIISVPGKGSFISPEAKSIINDKNREKTEDFRLLARKLMLAGMSKDQLDAIIAEEAEDIRQGKN